MKKLIFILWFMLNGICFGFEYSELNFPKAEFKSVNVHEKCVDYSPHITPVGATSVYEYETDYRPPIRRVRPDSDPGDPYPTPIGNEYILILFASAYIIYKQLRLQYL